jgi:hypothetical protein
MTFGMSHKGFLYLSMAQRDELASVYQLLVDNPV